MTEPSKAGRKALTQSLSQLSQAATNLHHAWESFDAPKAGLLAAEKETAQRALLECIVGIKRVAEEVARLGNLRLPQGLERLPRPIAGPDVLHIPIEDLPGLSNRVRKALAGVPTLDVTQEKKHRRKGLRTLGELAQVSEEGLARIPNLGAKSVRELLTVLKDYGLKPGMDAKDKRFTDAGVACIVLDAANFPSERRGPDLRIKTSPLAPGIEPAVLVRTVNNIGGGITTKCRAICSTLFSSGTFVREGRADDTSPPVVGELIQIDSDKLKKEFRILDRDSKNDFDSLVRWLHTQGLRLGTELTDEQLGELGLVRVKFQQISR